MSPPLSSEHPSPVRGRRSKWRVAACAFLVFHLGAITMANVSRSTALGAGFHRPFDLYLALTRLDQSWDMFITIPHYRDLGGSLVAIDAGGHETRYGSMLPGLKPFLKDPRIEGTFLRLAFYADMYPGYSPRYLAAVCRAITEKTGHMPDKVAFDLWTAELRPVARIRVDGRIGEPKTLRYGPAACRL